MLCHYRPAFLLKAICLRFWLRLRGGMHGKRACFWALCRIESAGTLEDCFSAVRVTVDRLDAEFIQDGFRKANVRAIRFAGYCLFAVVRTGPHNSCLLLKMLLEDFRQMCAK